jgi:hypothetical protein
MLCATKHFDCGIGESFKRIRDEMFILTARGRTNQGKSDSPAVGTWEHLSSSTPGRRSRLVVGVQSNRIGRGYRSEVGRLRRTMHPTFGLHESS